MQVLQQSISVTSVTAAISPEQPVQEVGLLGGVAALALENQLISQVMGDVLVNGDLANHRVGTEVVRQLRLGVVLGHPIAAEAGGLRYVGVQVRDQFQVEPNRLGDGRIAFE